MTMPEACRQYNLLVTQMLDAARNNNWERVFDLDQESRRYSDFLLDQEKQGVQIVSDEKASVFLAEIISHYAEISKLASTQREDIKKMLSFESKTRRLEKMYGG